MNFREHAIAGLITGSAVTGASYYFSRNIPFSLLMGAVTVAGSIAPDVDTGSIPSRIFAWIGIALAAVFMYFGKNKNAAATGIIYMAFSSDRHRGATHSWVLIMVCAGLGYAGFRQWMPIYFILMSAFSVGLITHKIIDS